jgi:hypothetical protein
MELPQSGALVLLSFLHGLQLPGAPTRRASMLVRRPYATQHLKAHRMSIRTHYAAVLSLCVVSSSVHAQDKDTSGGAGPAAAFGGVWQIVVSSDATLTIQHTTPNTTTVSVSPAADVFVVRNLSVGGALSIDYVVTRYFSTTSVGVGARVGILDQTIGGGGPTHHQRWRKRRVARLGHSISGDESRRGQQHADPNARL